MKTIYAALLTALTLGLIAAPGGAEGAEAWSPSAVDGGTWTAEVVDRAADNGVIEIHRTCGQVFSRWRRTDDVGFVVRTYRCSSVKDARDLAGLQPLQTPPLKRGPVLGADIDNPAWLTVDGEGVAFRSWAQASNMLVAMVFCAKLDQNSCFKLADAGTVSLAKNTPGEPVTVQTPMANFLYRITISLFYVWLFFAGFAFCIRMIRYQTAPLPRVRSATWTDISRASWRLRWRALGWGATIGARRYLYGLVLIVLYGIWYEPGWRGVIVLIVLAVLIALTVAASRRLTHPVFKVRLPWRELWRNARSPIHFIAGVALRILTWLGLAHLLIAVILAIYIQTTGGPNSKFVLGMINSGAAAKIASGEGSLRQEFFFMAAMFGVQSVSELIVISLIIGVGVLLLVDRLGQRLLTPRANTTGSGDGRPTILYLRNFGDDRLRLLASRISRRGILGRLSPWRTRPFEDVVLRRLSSAGNAVAVNPPESLISRPGLPKMDLANENWQETVQKMAHDALFVVVSATPRDIRPGFEWELKMIADGNSPQSMGHTRTMLVFGPWRRRRFDANWSRFRAFTSGWPLFAAAATTFHSPATHVMVHLPGLGWEAWGAATRSEWTYAMALNMALERAVPVWERDRQLQSASK